MRRSVCRGAVAAALLAVAAPAAAAQRPAARAETVTEPLVVGETFTIASATLRETRRVDVYLPPEYAGSRDARLPVLYTPDGGLAEDFLHVAGLVQVSVGNGTMRPFILVGIENTERRLAGVLERGAFPALAWRHDPMPGETHATIFHPAALRAFRALFRPAARE